MGRLFRWLISWFRKTQPLELLENGERLDVYRPSKRLVFSYFDGTNMVRADPMTLYRKLVLQGVDIKTNLKAFHEAQTETDALTAHAGLVSQVNQAFNLKPYEEGGLTSVETLACWDKFLHFVGFTNQSAPTSLAQPKPPEKQPPPAEPEPVPAPTPPPTYPPTLAHATEVSNEPPVVTIELDPEQAAVLTQGTANLPVLQRSENGEGGPPAPVQETNG